MPTVLSGGMRRNMESAKRWRKSPGPHANWRGAHLGIQTATWHRTNQAPSSGHPLDHSTATHHFPLMESGQAQVTLSSRLVTGIDPSTRDGLSRAFAHGAIECLMSAKELERGFLSNFTGEYILTFHAIELGLKAFLIKCGECETTLRRKPYGHDLVKLYEKAKEHGLCPNVADIENLLMRINEWHNDRAKIRYDFTRQRTLPACATLFPLAEVIINATR